MTAPFAGRTARIHRSFLTEILGVTENPDVISFAGGLPNSDHFPVEGIAEAAARVLDEGGRSVLQYTTTQGYPPLREYIAAQYRARHGLDADPRDIIITNGSQQGFDLIGKILLDPGDRVIAERPAYHGALQAFSLYDADIVQVPLLPDGPDVEALSQALQAGPAKFFYGVPNFQNPSGLTYSLRRRQQVAGLLRSHGAMLVEDDPYSELRFEGEDLPPIKKFFLEGTILLGTFSKTVAPGFRIGWAWAQRGIVERLVEVKQAADFHSDHFAQRLLHRYLADNDLPDHVAVLRETYRKQRDVMLAAIERHVPEGIEYTRPEGGMFIYMTLPEGLSSLDLFAIAARRNVVFVPGAAFHAAGKGGESSMRLSFSSSGEAQIEEGMRRLGEAIRELMATRQPGLRTED